MKTYIENPNPELYSLLKWLKGNVSTDDSRPVLQAINIKRNRIEATTGYALVIAMLEAPIKFYADLDDGLWIIETVTKKLAILSTLDEGNFPDVDVIATGLHLNDKHVCLCFNPNIFKNVTEGFQRVYVNAPAYNAPMEIMLYPDGTYPDGTYLAIVMPMLSDVPIEAVMTDAFSKLVSDKS